MNSTFVRGRSCCFFFQTLTSSHFNTASPVISVSRGALPAKTFLIKLQLKAGPASLSLDVSGASLSVQLVAGGAGTRVKTRVLQGFCVVLLHGTVLIQRMLRFDNVKTTHEMKKSSFNPDHCVYFRNADWG